MKSPKRRNNYRLILPVLAIFSSAAFVAVLAVMFVVHPQTKTKQQSNVLGADTQTPVEVAALAQPGVVRILTKVCATLKITDKASNIDGKEYPFCGAFTGSGFFFNKNGYLATNGHVVSLSNTNVVAGGIFSGNLDSFMADTIKEYLQYDGVYESNDDVQKFLDKVSANPDLEAGVVTSVEKLLKDSKATLTNQSTDIFVQLGKEPFHIDKDLKISETDHIKKATLIDKDYQESAQDDTGFHSSDIAILKVANGEYPALTLGDSSDVKVLQPVIVLGFPGVVTDIHKLIDTPSEAEVTVTGGVISSIKAAAGNQKRLFQTDATLSYGNSGGPGIDDHGNVIGIATYAVGSSVDSGSNYSFLRDVGDLKALMAKHGLVNDTSGKPTVLWLKGLQEYWNAYYKRSLRTFAQLKTVYPSHNEVDRYIDNANQKIKEGKDQTPIFDNDLIFAIGIGISVGMIILGTATFFLSKKKK